MHRPAIAALTVLLLPLLSPQLSAADTSPANWQTVAQTTGELTFVCNATAYALSCPTSAFADALAQVSELPETRRDIARTILIAGWAERDTAGAIAARKSAAEKWTSDQLVPFYQALAGVSPDQALQLISAEPDSTERSRCYYFTLQKLSTRDPARTVREIQERKLTEGEDGPWFTALWAGLEPANALDATLTKADTPERDQLLISILQEWLEKDPAQPFAWTTGHLKPPLRDEAFARLAQALAYSDWDALRKRADTTEDPTLRAILEKAIAESTSWQPPETLWAQVSAHGWKNIPEHSLSSLLEYAATRPHDEAVAFFRSVPAALVNHEYASDELSEPWTLADPNSALAWARALPDASLRDHTLLHINSMLTEVDPDMAIAQIEQTTAGPLQTKLIRNTALAFARRDLDLASEWVFSLPAGTSQNEALDALAIGAARNHPVEFAATITALPEGLARTRLFGEFAAKWLREDIGAASGWLLALPDGPDRSAALKPALDALAHHSPAQALALAPSITAPADRLQLIQQLAAYQSVQHTDEILALIETLPESRRKKQIANQVLQKLAEDDPATMAEMISGGALGPPDRGVVDSVIRNWKTSPQAAANWASELLADDQTPERDRTSIASSVAWTLASRDPAIAEAWARQLPAGKIRTAAVDNLSRNLAQQFPARGLRLAAELGASDNALRTIVNDTLSRILPGQARELINNSPLPEDRKTKALSWIKP